MHSKIAVTEPEPCLAAQCSERLHEIPAFVRAPPAAFEIAEATERIDHGVDVRRDMQAEMLEIIAGIDDNCQVRADQALESERELGAPYPAAQCDHRPAAKRC